MKHVTSIVQLTLIILFLVSLGFFLWSLAQATGMTGQQFPGEEAIGPLAQLIFFFMTTALLGVLLLGLFAVNRLP